MRRTRFLGSPAGRRLAAWLAAAALLASTLASPGAARADFGQDEKKFDNAAYPAEFRARVTQAILQAANWLLSKQEENGSWSMPQGASYPLGPTALVTLACLKSGIPKDHPKIERAFAYMRAQPLAKTYEVAILLMALDAKYDPVADGFAVETTDRYGNRIVSSPCAQNVSKEDLAWMKEGVDFLVKHQDGGKWRYPGGGFDMSNTQYALLGLKAASRCGLKIASTVWVDALTHLLSYQEADGAEVSLRANEVRGDYRIEWTEKAKARGFRYSSGAPLSGSMTTAGAAGLMICQSELWKSRKFTGEMRTTTRLAIRDALAWMQKNFAVTHNPGLGFQGPWHFYYLYGLERMGILAHTRFLGPIDWYLEGADYLLHEQKEDGHWEENEAQPQTSRFVLDTCFALLFLKRGSFRTENPVITPSDPDPAGKPGGTPPVPAMGG